MKNPSCEFVQSVSVIVVLEIVKMLSACINVAYPVKCLYCCVSFLLPSAFEMLCIHSWCCTVLSVGIATCSVSKGSYSKKQSQAYLVSVSWSESMPKWTCLWCSMIVLLLLLWVYCVAMHAYVLICPNSNYMLMLRFGFGLHHSLELDVLIYYCNLSLAAVSLKFAMQNFSQIDRISLVQSYWCI